MRRKIVSHGPSSMTVSLPSTWVKNNNLQKGEEVEILEEDNHLSIRPVCITNDHKTIEVSFIDLDKDTQKDLILTLHKKGYDEIKIKFNNQELIKELHEFLNLMQLGFEIIKQETNSITIRNISNPAAEQLDNLFRRVFRITIEYSAKIEAVINNKEEITQSVLLHETSISRIANYCKRIIIKEKRQNACFLYAIIEELTTITSNLTILLSEIQEINTLPKTFVTKYAEMNNLLIQVYNLYYKFTLKEYSFIKKVSENLIKQVLKMQTQDITGFGGWDILESIHGEIQNLFESTLAVQF